MTEAHDGILTLLEAYNATTLGEIAAAGGLAIMEGKKKLTKAALLQRMADGFFTRERVLASWRRLDRRERAVLNQLLLRGGKVTTAAFRREILRAKLATEGKPPEKSSYSYYEPTYAASPHRPQSPVFEDVIARLTLQGLVFSQNEPVPVGASRPYAWKFEYDPGPILCVPDAVRRHLPEPEAPPISTAPEPPTVKAGDPEVLLVDLYLYWDYLRHNEVPLTKTGLVPKRLLRAINGLLLVPDSHLEAAGGEPEAGRLLLLRQMLAALGLVRSGDGVLRPAGEGALAISEFWSWPQDRQLAACLEAWPGLGGCGELGAEAEGYSLQYARARQAVLKALRAMPATGWMEPEELLDRVRMDDLDFLLAEHSRAEASRQTWYQSALNNRIYGRREDILRRLEAWEARFVEGCLTGFLHQIGLVELGYDGDQLRAFRLTALGCALLGREGAPRAAEAGEAYGAGRVVIQPSFQVLAVGPVGLHVLARLDLCAEREQAGRGAFSYRLSRASLYRAQQLGMDAAAVIAFLEQTAAVELPQNVRRSLEEWGAHHERIVFRSGVSLLQAATPELLRELSERPETGPFLARPVAHQVALVAQDGPAGLIAALVERGLFPAISGADPQSADHGVTIDDDGAIRAIHEVPSLHLRGRLSRLAEEAPATDGRRWRLTPGSVARAGGSKARVLELLEELARLSRGPLPERLVEQVKAWGGYYGHASAQTLTLIEFRDASALDELRQHPALKRYLTPFRAGNRALAVVAEGKLGEVREVLASLGVPVKEGL